ISGGTVLSKDGAVSVSIPLNALKEDVAIQVNNLSPDAAPPVVPARRLLAATEFQPPGLEVLLPATLKMSILGKQKPGYFLPLEFVNRASNQYEPSGSVATIGPDGTSAGARISRFNMFALTEEKPNVRVTPSPITVEVGQRIQFTATVNGNGVE